MVEKIILFATRNRFLVFAIVSVVIVWAYILIKKLPLDAIPDLSETQVIIFTEWMGRSPDLIEDQITYPITSKMLAAPKVKEVRGYSMFGMSFIYIIFEDGIDEYWARSRVLEYLSPLKAKLPPDANPILGPDSTSLGWIFQYALIDTTGKNDLSHIRAFQEFNLRYAIESVEGVAEVASIGGFMKQYNIELNPTTLYSRGISIREIISAVRRSNLEVGGRIIEMSEKEYYVRGRGYVQGIKDIEEIIIKTSKEGIPIKIKDIANVSLGPDIRRGGSDFNGIGEAVGAVVIMRYRENALNVIERVKKKVEEIKKSFPEGVEFKIVYDRSGLIERAIETLKKTLIEEMIVVSLVIIIFLLHFRSAIIPIITLPVAVLISFIPMYFLGITPNIMSLGGIAIAIGAMVDGQIVMVEASHKALEKLKPDHTSKERDKALNTAFIEVTPSIFYALVIVAVAFLPVFTLTGQAGKLFTPLAWTKTFAMLTAAILSITLTPGLKDLFIRGKIYSEKKHPISRFLIVIYKPFVYVGLKNPITTILIGTFAFLSAIPIALNLGTEFMPPLNEGDVLYMPITFPSISIEEAKRYLQYQDRVLKSFPEVNTVFGKIGRAETPTDPAPLSMVETVVQLKPPEQWRKLKVKRWYSAWAPQFLKKGLRLLFPEERHISWEELMAEFDKVLKIPGWTNAWTMPIKTRIDMLTTGIRTPVGIKIFGEDLKEIERVGIQIEKALSKVDGVRSVFYERNLRGVYIDIIPDRHKLARFGLNIDDINEIIETAIGGMPLSLTVEGRERWTINIRYPKELREDVESVKKILIPVKQKMPSEDKMGNTKGMSNSMMTNVGNQKTMEQITLDHVAEIKVNEGPPMIRDEDGMLVGYVFIDVDLAKTDIGSFVNEAKKVVEKEVVFPKGYFPKWTGQYELMEVMQKRMKMIIPLTIFLVFMLLYLNFRNFIKVLIIFISLPFSLIGSVWLMHLLNHNVSTASWVGVIALLGLAAETGIVMIIYLDIAFEPKFNMGLIKTKEDLIDAVLEGSAGRVRPKMMTVGTTFIGLVPLLWAEGSGADVMRRLAAPMIGGLFTSTFLTLEIIPVIYTYWRWYQIKKKQK